MLAIPPFGASSNIALWRANIKPPVELVVDDLDNINRQIRLSYQGVVAGMTAFLFNKLTCKARRRLVLSQRILHTLYIFSHRPCGILAIFSHQLDDGGTHDSAV